MQKIKLGDVCKYAEDRIAVSTLTKKNYISTENLLPNKGGITIAATLPKISTTPAFQVGDILISNIRQYFKKIWYANFNGGCSNDVLVLRTNKDFDSKFLYYVLSEDKFFDFATATSKGTKMPRGDKQILMTYPMPNFPLETQKKIGAFLYSLDEKISLNKKINATLEAMAKTLYDYWFVQFDFPDENGKPYKSSGGKMIFNAELGREIPEGWQVGKLSEFGNLKNGINYDKNTIGDALIKIVNVKDISASSLAIAIESLENIKLPSKQIKKYLTSDEDILIARSGIPGAVRILAGKNVPVIYCGFIICLKLFDKSYKNYLIFNLQKNYEIILTQSAGTIMQNVTQETLKKLQLAMPPAPILKNFNLIINQIISEMQKNLLENFKLSELRDFLLPLLMNGQVGFKE